MGLMQLVAGLEGAEDGDEARWGMVGWTVVTEVCPHPLENPPSCSVWWMDSHVHLHQQGSCGDPVPVGHKQLWDPQRRDVLVAQNSVMTERCGYCSPVAGEWRSTGHHKSYPGKLIVRFYRALDPEQSPVLLPCAVLCGGPPRRWTRGTALWSGKLSGTSSEALHIHLQGWRGAGCLPLPLTDSKKSPDFFALVETGKKDSQGGGYSDNLP